MKSSDYYNEDCHYLKEGSVWRHHYLTDETYPNLVAVTVINSLAVLPTILLNALVIIAVAKRHQLRTKSNILVACLAGSDLLSALVVQPIGIAVELKRIFGDGPFCSLEKALFVVSVGVGFTSLGNLVLMSLDRYISIRHPLRYTTTVTTKRIKTGLILAWGIGLLVSINELILAVIDSGTEFYLHYLKVGGVVQAILATADVAVIFYTYCYIFLETRRQRERLKTEQLPQEEAKRMKRESKAAITLAIILGTLVLSYTPTIVLALVLVCTSHDILEPHIMSVLWSWISTFALLGTFFNPIIFFWRVKKLRRAILEIVHYRQPENSLPPIEMVEIKRHRPEIQPSTCEAFSRDVVSQVPVMTKYCQFQAEEIVHIEETEVKSSL